MENAKIDEKGIALDWDCESDFFDFSQGEHNKFIAYLRLLFTTDLVPDDDETYAKRLEVYNQIAISGSQSENLIENLELLAQLKNNLIAPLENKIAGILQDELTSKFGSLHGVDQRFNYLYNKNK